MLSDVRPEDIVVDPYPHYVRRDAIAPETFQQLAEEFPSLETILGGRSSVGDNVAVRMPAKQVLDDPRISPAWREFFAYHTSADYWRDIIRLFGDHIRREFPDLETASGRRLEDWRVKPRGFDGAAEVRLDCQFVVNTPVAQLSSVKTAHVDICDKIFSALFYFRDGKDDSTGGDFDIYRWKRAPRFIKHRSLNRDVELVKTVRYAANTYLCFVNSARAVHGVSPRGITRIPRRYINFIAELPQHAFEPKQLGFLDKLRYLNEARGALQEEPYQ
jgi:hypothetical protein